MKRIRPVDARGGIWSARKIRAAHREGGREGGGGDRDGYAPGKRWSPSTVGRKRKYWDWLSPCTGQRSPDSRYGKRVCPRRGSFPSPSPPPSTSSTVEATAATTDLPRPPSLPPRREVGTDSPLTRREPRCAIHFCPLTSPFPRLPLPPRVQGLPFRSEQWGIPVWSWRTNARANLHPFSPIPPRNYSEIVFSRCNTPKVWLLVFRYPPPRARPSYDHSLPDI